MNNLCAFSPKGESVHKLKTRSILFLILFNCLIILLTKNYAYAQSNCKTDEFFELGDTSTYKERLYPLLKCEILRSLTITVTENKGWVVFSSIQGTDQGIKYSTRIKLGNLPEELTLARNLESLDVSDLGLDQLPQNFAGFSKLKVLDISFNRISISKELKNIVSIDSLEVLKIYGCNFSAADLKEMSRHRPKLKIFYTQEHLLKDYREKRLKDN
jgi:hypothetical protein